MTALEKNAKASGSLYRQQRHPKTRARFKNEGHKSLQTEHCDLHAHSPRLGQSLQSQNRTCLATQGLSGRDVRWMLIGHNGAPTNTEKLAHSEQQAQTQ